MTEREIREAVWKEALKICEYAITRYDNMATVSARCAVQLIRERMKEEAAKV